MEIETIVLIGSSIGAAGLALDQWRRRHVALGIIDEAEENIKKIERSGEDLLERFDLLQTASDERLVVLDELRANVLENAEESVISHDRYQATLNARDETHAEAMKKLDGELAEALASENTKKTKLLAASKQINSLRNRLVCSAEETNRKEGEHLAEVEKLKEKMAGMRPKHSARPPSKGTGSLVEQVQATNDRILSESNDDYRDRLYMEYCGARASFGEKPSAREKFIELLTKQESVTKARHGCKTVRFRLEMRGTQVSLVPEMILNEEI